jgi:MFS transporter, DHA2 family, multidrug resistance protein
MSKAAPPRAGTARMDRAQRACYCMHVLYVMDLTVLHLAVPHISADLQPTTVELLWIIDIISTLN